MFESDNVTHSIYQLIEEACIVLMDFSFTLKTHDASMPLHRAVYYRMLWSECVGVGGGGERFELKEQTSIANQT